MWDVKITVKRVARYDDLIAQYENPIEHACSVIVGKSWISNGWEKPKDFCQSAWDSLSPFILALSHGGQNLYDGWMKNSRSAMISCNDGFRPVSFYIEALDEDADIWRSIFARFDWIPADFYTFFDASFFPVQNLIELILLVDSLAQDLWRSLLRVTWIVRDSIGIDFFDLDWIAQDSIGIDLGLIWIAKDLFVNDLGLVWIVQDLFWIDLWLI